MASTTGEQSSNPGGGSGTQASEFVILLGEEGHDEGQSPAEPPAAKPEAEAAKNPGEFVILLGEDDNESNAASTTNDDAQDCVLSLGKENTINHVNELHKTMLELIKDRETITIDASQIEQLDTAGVQLLCSFVKEAERQHKELLWKQPSAAFTKISSRLDLLKNLNTESMVQH